MPRVVEFLGVDVEELNAKEVQQLLNRGNFHGQNRETFLEEWGDRKPHAYVVLEQILNGYAWIAGEWRYVTREDQQQAAAQVDELTRKLNVATTTHAAFYAQAAANAERMEYAKDPAAFREARRPKAVASPEIPASGAPAADDLLRRTLGGMDAPRSAFASETSENRPGLAGELAGRDATSESTEGQKTPAEAVSGGQGEEIERRPGDGEGANS